MTDTIHIPADSWRKIRLDAPTSDGTCSTELHVFTPVFDADTMDIRCQCGKRRIQAKRTDDGGWDVIEVDE